MPIKTPLAGLLSISMVTCFDRKRFSACYQSEDVKDSSQSIRVVMSLAGISRACSVREKAFLRIGRCATCSQDPPCWLCFEGEGSYLTCFKVARSSAL